MQAVPPSHLLRSGWPLRPTGVDTEQILLTPPANTDYKTIAEEKPTSDKCFLPAAHQQLPVLAL